MDLFGFGSGECDQLQPEDGEYEIKIPKKIKELETEGVRIVDFACGSMHSLALTSKGEVYSWGCNDDGALGREGEESKPAKVELPFPAAAVAAGESHSVAYNKILNRLCFWGMYRDPQKGPICENVSKPKEISSSTWKNKKIKKVVCGSNHTLILADKTLYSWGNYTDFQLGRYIGKKDTVRKYMTPSALPTKNVLDVFVGKNQNFCLAQKGKKTQLKAWGANGCGQLGLGHKETTMYPTLLEKKELEDIKCIAGGDFFTLFLKKDGKMVSVGRNDQNQLGIGDSTKVVKTEDGREEKDLIELDLMPIKEDSKGNKIKRVNEISCSNDFSYAKGKEIYAWGFGGCHVLGSEQEENQKKPNKVRKAFFKGKTVHKIGLGAQHVVVGLSEKKEVDLSFEIDYNLLKDKKRMKRKAKKYEKE